MRNNALLIRFNSIGRLCCVVSLYIVVIDTFDHDILLMLNAAMCGAMSSSAAKLPL